MPLHATSFGISLGLVGVVLSVNRIVRVLGYGWVSVASRRFGLRALTASAALGAAVSTVVYGIALGLVPLVIARLVWGMAYAVLNVTTTAYAMATAGARAGASGSTGR